jgi:hypothetical protein
MAAESAESCKHSDFGHSCFNEAAAKWPRKVTWVLAATMCCCWLQ